MGDVFVTKTHTTALKIAAGLWVIWGLVHMLAEAQRVRAGVADPVSGRRVPWIAAPTRSASS